MNEITLIPLKTNWRIESVSEPKFCYDPDDLNLVIELFVYINDRVRGEDIKKGLKNENCIDEKDLDDFTYNHAGFRIARLEFREVYEVYFTSNKETIDAVIQCNSSDNSLCTAVYEEVGFEDRFKKYWFVGHDTALSVLTSKCWIENLVQIEKRY